MRQFPAIGENRQRFDRIWEHLNNATISEGVIFDLASLGVMFVFYLKHLNTNYDDVDDDTLDDDDADE